MYFLLPQDLNIFQSQIPQQMMRSAINNRMAISRLISIPQNGKKNKPTNGRVHNQTTTARIISSKCRFSLFNTTCLASSDFYSHSKVWKEEE